MGAIDVDALTFVDLSEDKYGSFVQSENLDKFIESPLGEAQVKSMTEEMKLQTGNDDYEPTTSQIRRALFSEQAAQEYGRAPDVTNEKMLEDNGPAWYEKLAITFGLVSDPDSPKPEEPAQEQTRGTGYFGVETGTDRALRELDKSMQP